MNGAGENKIVFANQLRGVAALIVLIWHFYCVFFQYPEAVVDLLGIKTYSISASPFISLVLNEIKILNLGQLGVAIFFLISGFVIPFSLKRYSIKAFATNRFFRLFPTYLVCLCLGIFVLYLIGSNLQFVTMKSFFAHIFFVRDWFFYPQIDGLVWTLEVEVKFYFISAFIYWAFSKNVSFRSLLSISFFLLCASEVFRWKSGYFLDKGHSGIVYSLESVFIFIPFLLIGWIFHLQFFLNRSLGKLIATISVIYMIFAFNLYRSIYFSELSIKMIFNYFIALSLFSLSFYCRELFCKNRILDWLANISYSLYASHALLGYSLCYFLYLKGVYVELVPAITIIICMATASTIFYLVEKRSKNMGKFFS